MSQRNRLPGRWGWLLLAVVIAALLRYSALDTIPPGLSFDEAGNGVAALDVARGQYRLWWPIGGGKEPLIVYLLQPLLWLFGPTRLALRLYAATMGILTVAGTYWLAWEMFVASRPSGRDNQGHSLLPLIAALGLATAFWHVAFSRVAFRALAMPAVGVLALAWLWRALRISESREGQARVWYHFAGAGALIGLGFYTYLPGRALPVVLMLFFVAEAGLAWLRNAQPLVFRHASGLAVSVVAALLVVSPLLVFFVRHPAAFADRAGVVSIFNPEWNQGDLAGTLLRVTLTTLGTFVALTGDPNPIANLPGRPMLGPVLRVFFWLGIIVSVWRVVRCGTGKAYKGSSAPTQTVSPDSWDCAPYLLLLCWWLVMLLPGILAPESPPHHLRIIGTAPATYILVAVGVCQTLAIASANLDKFSESRFFRYAEWLVVLVFLVVGLVTARDYFTRWAKLPELYMVYDVYALELAEQMSAETDSTAAYVIPMDLRAGHEARHYTLDYLHRDGVPFYYLPVNETTIDDQLTQVAAGHETLRVVRWLQDKHAAADEREVVTFLLAGNARLIDEEIYPVYRTETWSLPSADTTFALPAIETDVGVTFGDVLRLEAVDLSVIGNTVALATRWAPLGAMDTDYKVSLRLVAADGSVVAQKDRFLRHNWHQGTSAWPPETVNEYYLLPSVPPGEYEVQVVVYHPETLAPLVVGGSGQFLLSKVQIE